LRKKEKLDSLELTTTYYAQLGGARILSITGGTDHSRPDDADVTDWVKATEFIVACNIWSGNKDTVASTYKLQWQDDTDGGGYTDLAASGEMDYTISDSSWSHGDAVATGDQYCDSQGGDTRVAGERIKNQSLSDSIDLGDDEQTELWFGVNSGGADDSHQYSFQLYSSAEGAAVGVLGATITMEAGSTLYYQDTGQHAMTISGSIVKRTSVPRMGAYAMAITGTLGSVKTSFQTTGGYAVPITGSLLKMTSRPAGGYALTITGTLQRMTSIPVGGYAIAITGSLVALKTFFQDVGGHAMAIAGSLVKQTNISAGGYSMPISASILKVINVGVGDHSMSITGEVAKLIYQTVGGYAMTITGSLGAVKSFFVDVGGHLMAIVGTLTSSATFNEAVGTGSVPMSGSLTKRASIGVGGHLMQISGSIGRLVVKNVGGYAMAIAGSLISSLRLLQDVGGYALNIVGSLATNFIPGGVGQKMRAVLRKIFSYYYR